MDARHSGAALGTRHLYSIDIRLEHAGCDVQNFRNLVCRYVLTLPPEGVADAIRESEPAVVAEYKAIPRVEETIFGLEDILENLLGWWRSVHVSVERSHRSDGRDPEARLALGDFLAPPYWNQPLS